MNNENSQEQAKSHVGGNDKLGINFAWPNKETIGTTVTYPVYGGVPISEASNVHMSM
jgi:hypothetical protein